MPALRPLRHENTSEVLRLNRAAAPAVFALDASELARLLALSPLHQAAAQDDGDLAGYALAFAHDHPYDGEEFLALRSLINAPFVYVDQIVVNPDTRAAGIGRMLYQALTEQAHRLGATVLCCEVNLIPPNPASLAFHHRMGFAAIGEMETSDGRRVVLLRKDLQAPATMRP